MCGIAGFNGKGRELCMNMTRSLSHRGPDQEGYYVDDDASLGHRRLSILDLSEKGRQPMADKKKNMIITFNGEIFNYQELKEDLKKLGYSFFSKTDTEVLIYAYEAYGTDFLKKLNGQFAFCIYDKKKKIFFIARDRVGILPLYYFYDGKKFIFSSEMKAIYHAGIEKKISMDAFNHYVMYGYTPRSQSILENVFKLEPAHYLIFDLKKKKIVKKEKYWGLNERKGGEERELIKDEQQAIKRIQETLAESVKKRLVADVPVGAFLSGGLDSSAVAAIMSSLKKRVKTFSVSFDEKRYDEACYAEKVSQKLGTEHTCIEFTGKDVKTLIPRLVEYYDEPFADPSMIPMFLVAKVAREKVTVCLSGDGGDELFGGYDLYKYYEVLEKQKYYPKFINNIMHQILKNFTGMQKIKAFFEIGTLQEKWKYARLLSYLSKKDFKELTRQDPEKIYEKYAEYYLKNQNDFLQTATTTDFYNYLPEDILTKVDRACMANSLESRPPILDHEMVELAWKIPSEMKMNGKDGKWIFKKAMEGLIPKEIIYRRKQGFAVPLEKYFKEDAEELLDKYVFSFDQHNYFDREVLKRKKENVRLMFAVLMFNLWWEKWMNSMK